MTEERFPIRIAERIAHDVYERLKATCKRIEIAGSIRRQSADVKDAEIVAIPSPATYRVLEEGVQRGQWQQALYGAARTPRWGYKYRGIDVRHDGRELRVEVFFTTVDSWGFMFWLRTGPSDGNKRLMQIMQRTPIRCQDGAVWYAEDWQAKPRADGTSEWLSDTKRRVIVPDELTWFRLWGMEYVPPEKRTATTYEGARFNLAAAVMAAPDIRQQSLF